MNIVDLYGNRVNIETVEKHEQDLANKYILENDIVLELGARYGSVSCTINSKLNNKNNNNCEFNIVKGLLVIKNWI
jgi:hypothetical protein